MKGFKQVLEEKMDAFVNNVFIHSKNFPRDEIYVTTAQLKRASLSVILNYIEGFARFKKKGQLHFLEISYGSLKESIYLLRFSKKQQFSADGEVDQMLTQADEIAAMLWTEIRNMHKSLGT